MYKFKIVIIIIFGLLLNKNKIVAEIRNYKGIQIYIIGFLLFQINLQIGKNSYYIWLRKFITHI